MPPQIYFFHLSLHHTSTNGLRQIYPILINPSQALVVAGGTHDVVDSIDSLDVPHLLLSSVLTLNPGAKVWTPLASLPRSLMYAQASVVGGRLRVIAGFDGSSTRSEVTVPKCLCVRHFNEAPF